VSEAEIAWLSTLRSLLAVLGTSDVEEFRYQGRALRLRLHRQPGADVEALAEAPGEVISGSLHGVRAPVTGVFYLTPDPQAEPYVHEGDWVEAGQPIGQIEAMKNFNEVVADIAGRVVRIYVEGGQLVHEGDVLLSLDPRAGGSA
jgi:acetyl-CoA carboxylase biotin carboxyl carrier protein